MRVFMQNDCNFDHTHASCPLLHRSRCSRNSSLIARAWAGGHPSWGQTGGWMSLSLSCRFVSQPVPSYWDEDRPSLAKESSAANAYKYANEWQNKHHPANEPSISDRVPRSLASARQHQSATQIPGVMERHPIMLPSALSCPPPHSLLLIARHLPLFIHSLSKFPFPHCTHCLHFNLTTLLGCFAHQFWASAIKTWVHPHNFNVEGDLYKSFFFFFLNVIENIWPLKQQLDHEIFISIKNPASGV